VKSECSYQNPKTSSKNNGTNQTQENLAFACKMQIINQQYCWNLTIKRKN
jgi:hypothetical protein